MLYLGSRSRSVLRRTFCAITRRRGSLVAGDKRRLDDEVEVVVGTLCEGVPFAWFDDEDISGCEGTRLALNDRSA